MRCSDSPTGSLASVFDMHRVRMSRFVRASLLGPSLAAAALAAASPPGIDDAALANEADGANWAAYGRGFSEQHYSPLRQINASNVSRLGLAWSLDLSFSNFATTAPIEVDGVIYFSPGVSEVRAVDARRGKELWRYDPEVYKVPGQKMRTAWGTRGLAFWKEKIYLGTRDGRLIAINAKTRREGQKTVLGEALFDVPRLCSDRWGWRSGLARLTPRTKSGVFRASGTGRHSASQGHAALSRTQRCRPAEFDPLSTRQSAGVISDSQQGSMSPSALHAQPLQCRCRISDQTIGTETRLGSHRTCDWKIGPAIRED